MHVPNFKLKNSVKTLLYKLQFVRDFFVLHPLREMQRTALADSVAYIREKMPLAVGLVNEREMFDMAFDRMPGEGLLLEFGVHKGGTINYAAERNPGREVHGFDSFSGLPSDWTGTHEEACLDDPPCNNGRIKCAWHGRVFAPLAEFNLADGASQRKNAGAYEISLAGTVVTISPHAAVAERSTGTGS